MNKATEDQFRLMVESVADYAIFMLDASGHVVTWNKGAERINGYKAEEIIGQHFSCFYPPEDVARGKPDLGLKEASAEGRFEDEDWRVRKDGSRFMANVIITPLRDDAGRLRGFAKVTHDITKRKRAEEAVHKANLTLQAIFDAAPVAVVSFDLEGRIMHWSRGAERMFGWTAEEVLGCVSPTIPPEELADFHEMIARVVRQGPEKIVRIRQKKSGERIYASINPGPLWDSEGKTYGVMVILEDITARKQYEDGLRIVAETVSTESGDASLKALTKALAAVLQTDFAFIGELVDERQERMRTVALWGEGKHHPSIEYALAGTPCENIIHQRQCCYPDDVRTLFPRDTWAQERQLQSYVGEPLRDEHGRVLGLISAMGRKPLPNPALAVSILKIFATRAVGEMERMRSHQALEHYSRRLRALSRQLLAAQETERRRIARELHDQVGQALTLLQLGLQNTRELEDAVAIRRELDQHTTAVEQILDEVRQLSLDLRPPMLDDLGLVPALRWYTDRVRRSSPMEVRFETGALSEPLPAETETACFRTAQEALSNVLRHSGARSVLIRLDCEEGHLVLTVRDDGCGFDPAEARRRASLGCSMGLLSMEERVAPAGGQLVLKSAPGNGTSVRAMFPLPTANSAI